MTLAQLEERVAALEQVKERLTALEQAVERLQSLENGRSNASSTTSEKRKKEDEEELILGTEYDLVVTVPPEETIYFQARIVSIEPGPPGLPLSKDDWTSLGLEDEGE
jgi:hypothetical protein